MLRNVFLCSELYFKAGDIDRRKGRLNSLRNLKAQRCLCGQNAEDDSERGNSIDNLKDEAGHLTELDFGVTDCLCYHFFLSVLLGDKPGNLCRILTQSSLISCFLEGCGLVIFAKEQLLASFGNTNN